MPAIESRTVSETMVAKFDQRKEFKTMQKQGNYRCMHALEYIPRKSHYC